MHSPLVRKCILLVLLLALPLAACIPPRPAPTTPTPTTVPTSTPGAFTASVDTTLKPEQPTIVDTQGNPQPVAVSQDENGVQSEFIEGIVLVRPSGPPDLQRFLDRYDGVVVGDNSVPEPPPELGITLTEAQRQPTEYSVRINLAGVDVATLPADAASVGLQGSVTFSSQAGLQTFAAVMDAKAAGFQAIRNYVSRDQQAPTPPMQPGTFSPIFSTQERANNPPPGFKDAFTEPRYGVAGSGTNVTLAWQYVAAHGFVRRPWVAIIDSGFYLNPSGVPLAADNDFASPGGAGTAPVQYDFTDNNYFADGPGPMTCSGSNPCFWHGTGSAAVAAGVLNNQLADAGTGGLVANQMLFRISGAHDQERRAIRTAVAWGADVVSMSFGGDCDTGCRIDDRDDDPFGDAVSSGSKTVFVAAAGNGRGVPAAGYDVGDPRFVHPCIESHVICVGALADNTTSAQPNSNFGGSVVIWAPTNIPVMSYPPSTGTDAAGNRIPLPISQAYGAASPQSFGGTSAAAPFVAGVAAMMKAINPNLNSDAVSRILVDTGKGGSPPVSKAIDALAAVKKAAEGIPNVEDRFEPNNLETTWTNLAGVPPYSPQTLSLNSRDRDYFRFDSPGGSMMTVQLAYPTGLGPISIFSLQGPEGDCEKPALVNDAAIANNRGHTFTYRVPGGSLLMGLRANDVNAYNLAVSFAARLYAPDSYEENNTLGTAPSLFTLKTSGAGLFQTIGIDSRFDIDATIHQAGDVDYYIVSGAAMSLAEQILLAGSPALTLSGNDSRIRLRVFKFNPDRTQGNQVADQTSASCARQPLVVRLDANTSYLVEVSGDLGSYSLKNGVSGERRRIPELVRDRVYEVLHPGEPVESPLRLDRYFVFVADPAYRSVRATGEGINLNLYDFAGNLVARSASSESLSLADTRVNQVYTLQAVPAEGLPEPPTLTLDWGASQPARSTDNLIQNPGAETTVGESDIPGWDVPEGTPSPRIYFYDDNPDNPTPNGPGPDDRGMHLVAGGPDNPQSAMQQRLELDPAWLEAIRAGLVKFNFSAYLGGKDAEVDQATAALTFLDEQGNPIGQVILPSIGPLERQDKTGLFPVALSDYVPQGAYSVLVTVTFEGNDGGFNDGYVDNLSLTLLEVGQ